MNGAIFIILLGPGKAELSRFLNLVDSLRHFEGSFIRASALVLVNDGNSEFSRERNVDALGFKEVRVISNPYAESGAGTLIYDRMLAGLLLALEQVVEMDSYDFVLKIDTDALASNSFAERIRIFFETHPAAGMIGSYHRNPDGTLRNDENWWAGMIRGTCGALPFKLMRLHWKNGIPFRFPMTIRRWVRRYRLMQTALRKGWRCGDNVLGGAYALSPMAIDALRSRKDLLQDPFLFEGTRISEDIGVSMLVAAMGFGLGEFNQPGEVFGVWYQKPTLSIKKLVETGYGLIHSVKGNNAEEEQRIRSEYSEAVGVPVLNIE